MMNNIKVLRKVNTIEIDVTNIIKSVTLHGNFSSGHTLGPVSVIKLLDDLYIAKYAIDRSVEKLTEELMKLDLQVVTKKEVVDAVRSEASDPVVNNALIRTNSNARKPSDTTKLTKWMYNYIVNSHNLFLEYKKTAKKQGRKTTQDLTDELNERLRLNKSRAFYTRVWNTDVDYIFLPKGNEIPLKY